jgi:hypothetical protein
MATKSKKPANKPAKKKLSDQDQQEIYGHLAICISRVTHTPMNDINPNDSLDKKYHFTPGGLVAFAGYLEAYFVQIKKKLPKPLDRGEMQKADTVQAIYLLLIKDFGGGK